MSYVLGLFTGLFVAIVFAIIRNIIFERELEETMKRFIEKHKEEKAQLEDHYDVLFNEYKKLIEDETEVL